MISNKIQSNSAKINLIVKTKTLKNSVVFMTRFTQFLLSIIYVMFAVIYSGFLYIPDKFCAIKHIKKEISVY